MLFSLISFMQNHECLLKKHSNSRDLICIQLSMFSVLSPHTNAYKMNLYGFRRKRCCASVCRRIRIFPPRFIWSRSCYCFNWWFHCLCDPHDCPVCISKKVCGVVCSLWILLEGLQFPAINVDICTSRTFIR